MSAKIFIGIANLSVISTFIVIGAFTVNVFVYSLMEEAEELIEEPSVTVTLN